MYKYIFSCIKTWITIIWRTNCPLRLFYDEYVKKRKWLDEKEYSDLVALCQFYLTCKQQVGIGIGTIRGGILGGIISFIGFTLPSVIILMVFQHYLLIMILV